MARCNVVRARLPLIASLAASLAAAVSLVALADPPRRTIDTSRIFSFRDAGSSDDAGTRMRVTPTAPDPAPLAESAQWIFDLRWDRGSPWLLAVHRVDLAAPQTTPRAMGRFALELYEGAALVERVRFDFPLLAANDFADGGFAAAPSLATKLRTRIGVMFPATARGTRLDLWDRATDRRWPLPWPPTRSPADAAADSL